MGQQIFQYTSLAEFLNEYVSEQKRHSSQWSIAKWAKAMGLKSTTSVTLILNSERNCGKSIGAALKRHFQFDEAAEKHFDYLVAKSKSPGVGAVSNLIENELLVASNSKRTIMLDDEQLELVCRWQSYCLRQLARIKPLKMDEKWLSECIGLTDGDDHHLVESLEHLVKFGFLEQKPEGFVARDVVLETSQDRHSEHIKKYHEAVGELGIKAIRRFDINQRSFQGCTLKIRRANISAAKKLVEKFMRDFETLADDPSGDSVYQLNLQFFPLAIPNV